MQSIRNKFISSSHELKSIQTLTVTSMLIVINLLLDLLHVRITISSNLRITFGFVAMALIGMLFGPVVGMISGFISDFLGYLLNPGGGAFFPGFTITAILGGLIWGLFLYQKSINLWRFVFAKLTINILLNIGLNTLWLCILNGYGALASFPTRVIKNLIMLPIEVLVLFAIAGPIYAIYRKMNPHKVLKN